MFKLRVALLKLVGRTHKMYDYLLQVGVVALPLAVVIAIFAYGVRDNPFSAILWFLCLFCAWIGWKSFETAKRKIERQEQKNDKIESERRQEYKELISLLREIADSIKPESKGGNK